MHDDDTQPRIDAPVGPLVLYVAKRVDRLGDRVVDELARQRSQWRYALALVALLALLTAALAGIQVTAQYGDIGLQAVPTAAAAP